MAQHRTFAFVLMPFDAKFDDVYRLGIQGAADAAGIEAKRLDDQLFDRSMLEQIYKEIDRSDLIIADMSGRNPNVFYEVGYADAKKKLIVFLTADATDIPFDLKHKPHIVYGTSILNLKDELTARLKWAADEVQLRREHPIKLNVAVLDPIFDRTEYTDTVRATFRIEVHNISDQLVQDIDSIYFFTKRWWSFTQDDKKCPTTSASESEESVRHIINPGFRSMPANDWRPVDVIAERVIWKKWVDKEPRPDSHKSQGMLRLALHTSQFQIRHEQKVEIVFTHDDLPF
jgi:hypothetical protein